MQTIQQLTRTDIEHLPHYRKKTTAGEYSAACPFCLAGKDRFLFWPDKGNYLCRQCGAKGFVIDAPGGLSFTPEQYEAWQRAEEARKAAERAAQLAKINEINQLDRASMYHRQMKDRNYWHGQGLSNATIDKYRLGWCPACPTYPASASWTIPVYYHGKLVNIRHRLVDPPFPNDKYRPETAGLPAAIFNADILDCPETMTVIVEGEIKAMVLCQYDFQAVGIPGAGAFKEKWVKLFEKCRDRLVYVALDPGADEQAVRIGWVLASAGLDVRVCRMPAKPDDMIVRYGASRAELYRHIIMARKVRL